MAKLPLSANHPPANNLLAALSPDVLARVSPELDVIPLKLRQFVHKAGEPIREVYFPGGGFISIVTLLDDGGMVEVATIGREGMLGMSAVLNGDPSPRRRWCRARATRVTACPLKRSVGRWIDVTPSTNC